MKKKTKCYARFAGNFQIEKKNTHYSLRIGTNNFQTDSLKAHKASKGHAMSLAAKHAGKWETKGGKTLACCIEQTWWRKIKENGKNLLCTYVAMYH